MDDDVLGGKYRFIRRPLLLGGPAISARRPHQMGQITGQLDVFPVLPWCYSSLWLGAYILCKYYFAWHPVPHLVPKDAPMELLSSPRVLHRVFWNSCASLAIGSSHATPQAEAAASVVQEDASSVTVSTVTDVLHDFNPVPARLTRLAGGLRGARQRARGPPIFR